MRQVFLWMTLIVWLVLGGIPQPASAQSTAPERDDGVVRAVLFWRESCPHCHIVIDQVFPPLQQQYGSQLDIRLIEASSAQNAQLLLQAADTFGIPHEQVGVPFLVIGDRVLIGSAQIPAELPGLIEQHLAQGGVDYPDVPGLAMALSPTAPSEATTPRPSGFMLAIVVMGGMVVALAATGMTVRRALRGTPPRRAQRGRRAARGARAAVVPPAQMRLERAIPLLALVGLGVAGYLAYVETQAIEAICGQVGDCNAVQSSPYAYLFGIIPIGVLGVVAYLGILSAWVWGQMRTAGVGRHAPLVVFGLALVGTLFSLYLTFLEPFVIGAVCAWCLVSAIVITLVLLASVGPALQAYGRLRQ